MVETKPPALEIGLTAAIVAIENNEPTTLVASGQEQLRVTTLGAADAAWADMQTLILVGNHTTRCIPRATARPWVYTPRRLDPAS